MYSRRSLVASSFVAAFVAALALTGGTARANEAAHQNVPRNRVAVQGYDVVSYFFAGQAKGNPALAVTHNGAVYHFANEFNRKLFAENPTKYAPAYGGWCATAMAKGEKVEIDPSRFKVTNGRLFLFYKGFWGDALGDWNKDEGNLTGKADGAWQRLVAK